MLLIFTGDDVVKAKAEAMKRAEGREVVRFGEGGEPFAHVGGYLAQQGMFSPQLALILDRPLDEEEGKELVFEHGDDLVSASALVIVIQPTIGALDKKKLPKGALVESFDISNDSKAEIPLTAFALTDAYTAGDRKGAWVTYRTLIGSGMSVEEVHGVLAWAVRSMVLAGKTKTAEEAGMKDFPYRKAKSAVARVGVVRAEVASQALVDVYHQARMGRGTLEDLLEVLLLTK